MLHDGAMWRMETLVALVAVGAPSQASAECAPREAQAPAEGPVPLAGSVFVHDEVEHVEDDAPVEPIVTWASEEGIATVRRLSPSIARVDYRGHEGDTLTVNGRHYTLAARRSRVAVPRILDVSRWSGSWTCSSHDVVAFETDQVSGAFHVRWTYGGTTADYYALLDDDRTVQLGKLDCGGTTIPPEQLAAGGLMELYAIDPDGSERLLRPAFEISEATATVPLDVGGDESARALAPAYVLRLERRPDISRSPASAHAAPAAPAAPAALRALGALAILALLMVGPAVARDAWRGR